MARKKSAAKRAKEAQEKLKVVEEVEKPVEDSVKQSIQEEFDSESESSSEEEDDYGELITEDVEEGINKVLDAIKTGDKALFDKDVKFFGNPEEEAAKLAREAKQKPIYLKDYHRMNLLAGNTGAEYDDEEEEQDLPRTYDQEKEEERNELLSEIKNAFNDAEDDDESDDGFMKKKEEPENTGPRRILPDPSRDEEKFLQEFANQHAWIPQKGDKIINLDKRGEEEDEQFEEAAERFENAYNFRYEDPNAAEIISYARNQATVRRGEMNSRRKKRELEKQEKLKEKKEIEKSINKKKTEKVNKLTDILEQVKKEYGADIDEKIVKKLSESLLDKDFDDSQWDNLLLELFNDDYYNDKSGKPTWDDDDELMKGIDQDGDEDDDKEQEDEKDGEDLGEVINDDDSEEPPKKKSKKDELKEKKSKKKDKKAIKELAEKAIEAQKLKIIDEVEEEREGRSKEKKYTFKYREVSPENYGLTNREIFLADDAELNEYIGLKKLAPYRTKEQRMKDKRKYAKAKNLKEWRKKVFKNENGPEGDDSDEIIIPLKDEKTKSKKRKHKD